MISQKVIYLSQENQKKFLQVSDFLRTIFENFKRNSGQTEAFKGEYQQEIVKFVTQFLLCVKEKIDYEYCCRIILQNNVHEQFMKVLKHTDDLDYSIGLRSKSPDKFLSSNLNFTEDQRQNLMFSMIRMSIQLEFYDVGIDIIKTFFQELILMKSVPIFSNLMDHVRQTGNYESKICLLKIMIPLMDNKLAQQIVMSLGDTINLPAENSIFTKNINPILVGLQILKLVDDFGKMFEIPSTQVDEIKNQLQAKLCNLTTIYKDHVQVFPLFEMPDLDGKNCFDYMNEFQLYDLLGTNLMQQYIDYRWNGRIETNTQILDLSSPHQIIYDKNKLYTGGKLF